MAALIALLDDYAAKKLASLNGPFAIGSETGTYGWNVESTEEFIQNEGTFVNMPIPIGTEETAAESESLNPYIKTYYWCASGGEIPAEAVKAGRDKDGGDIFIGRAVHEGEIQPAKIIPNHDCAYIAFDGEEIRKDEYEILCRGQAAVIWQHCEEGSVPPNAVPVGCTADSERLFVGRVFHDGTHTPGKVQPSLGVCCIPYGGEELQFSSYEVLILQ